MFPFYNGYPGRGWYGQPQGNGNPSQRYGSHAEHRNHGQNGQDGSYHPPYPAPYGQPSHQGQHSYAQPPRQYPYSQAQPQSPRQYPYSQAQSQRRQYQQPQQQFQQQEYSQRQQQQFQQQPYPQQQQQQFQQQQYPQQQIPQQNAVQPFGGQAYPQPANPQGGGIPDFGGEMFPPQRQGMESPPTPFPAMPNDSDVKFEPITSELLSMIKSGVPLEAAREQAAPTIREQAAPVDEVARQLRQRLETLIQSERNSEAFYGHLSKLENGDGFFDGVRTNCARHVAALNDIYKRKWGAAFEPEDRSVNTSLGLNGSVRLAIQEECRYLSDLAELCEDAPDEKAIKSLNAIFYRKTALLARLMLIR